MSKRASLLTFARVSKPSTDILCYSAACTTASIFTGVTWFWCDEGTDNGPICEQEILPLDLFTRPGEFCAREVLPALARTLTSALADLARVSARRRPQYEAAVTHERPIATKQHSFRADGRYIIGQLFLYLPLRRLGEISDFSIVFSGIIMRITLCLLLLLVLSSCDRSSLLTGDIAITAGIGSGRLNTPSDTTGRDKYQVEAEWVTFTDSASGDEGERALIRYQVTFWTRDEVGVLHRHGAVLYETPQGSDRFKNLSYKWYNDYSLMVRLESAEEMSSREFYLYGWKNASGMSFVPTEWEHPAPDIDSVSM